MLHCRSRLPNSEAVPTVLSIVYPCFPNCSSHAVHEVQSGERPSILEYKKRASLSTSLYQVVQQLSYRVQILPCPPDVEIYAFTEWLCLRLLNCDSHNTGLITAVHCHIRVTQVGGWVVADVIGNGKLSRPQKNEKHQAAGCP